MDYYNEIKNYQILTKEEERQLFINFKNGDLKAKEKLILSNLKLVVSIAKNFGDKNSSLDDLIQEGNIGLMEAIDEFDLSKENRLSTFATIKIKQKIIKFLKNNRHKILINKLNDLKEEYYKINGTKLTDEEICQKLEISYEILSKIQKTTNITSLDIPINDDESLINTISSEENEIEENIFKKDLKNIVNNLLEHLSEPHKELIDLYFGLNGNEPISGHKIANMKGYTYQTFYKKLKTILNHLRKIKEVQDLTDYMQHPTTTINFLKICSGEISTNDIDHLEKHLFKTKKTKY